MTCSCIEASICSRSIHITNSARYTTTGECINILISCNLHSIIVNNGNDENVRLAKYTCVASVFSSPSISDLRDVALIKCNQLCIMRHRACAHYEYKYSIYVYMLTQIRSGSACRSTGGNNVRQHMHTRHTEFVVQHTVHKYSSSVHEYARACLVLLCAYS